MKRSVETALAKIVADPSINIVELAREYGISRAALYYHLKKTIPNRKILRFNHDFFEKIDSEEKAYWLGFIYADGNICDTTESTMKLGFHLAVKDAAHLHKFHASIQSKNKVYQKPYGAYSCHYSNKLCNDLIWLGCTPRKSLTLTFPQLQTTFIRHFIRGYFDGDGCIYFHKNKEQKSGGPRLVIIGTPHFLGTIQDILRKSVNIKPKKLGQAGKASVLSIGGYTEAKSIAKWLYDGSTVFLERKYKRYREWC